MVEYCELIWTRRAQKHMKQASEYISLDSVKNAGKVLDDIVLALSKATQNPEIYAPDKLKKNNDGSYRAFEKHSYRITDPHRGNIILVLRVRHTSREPLSY